MRDVHITNTSSLPPITKWICSVPQLSPWRNQVELIQCFTSSRQPSCPLNFFARQFTASVSGFFCSKTQETQLQSHQHSNVHSHSNLETFNNRRNSTTLKLFMRSTSAFHNVSKSNQQLRRTFTPSSNNDWQQPTCAISRAHRNKSTLTVNTEWEPQMPKRKKKTITFLFVYVE